jgi:hypothetical protein
LILEMQATLRNLESGSESPVRGKCFVGRASGCQLRILASDVSTLHAQLSWTGAYWQLRALDYRATIFVDGRRLAIGEEAVVVEGSVLAFGVPERRFILLTA